METEADYTEHQEDEATQDSDYTLSQTSVPYRSSTELSSAPEEKMEYDGNSPASPSKGDHPVKTSESESKSDKKDHSNENSQNPDVSIFEQALGNMQEDINFKESSDSENDSRLQPQRSLTDSQLAFLLSLGISVMVRGVCNGLGG